MDIRQEIKTLLIKRGITMTELNKRLNEKKGTNLTIQNLSTRLQRNSLKYSEVEEILEILDCEIIIKDK